MGEQLQRQHYILQLLRQQYPETHTYESLADAIEDITRDRRPAKRTLLKDIDALLMQGHPIHRELEGRYTLLCMEPGRDADELLISDIQLLALSVAEEVMRPLTGTVFWSGIREFWHQTSQAVPEATRRHFERKRQNVIVRGMPAKSYTEKGGILGTIFEAQLAHREVAIIYNKPSDDRTPPLRTIRPYSLAFYHGSIFIVAVDAGKASRDTSQKKPKRMTREQRYQHFRTFKLDRIDRALRLDTFFDPDETFDAQDYFQHTMSMFTGGNEKPVRMQVRLDPSIVSHVREQPWHDDQEIRQRTDGRQVLILPSVYQSEVISKVLSYGGQAEILTPKSSRLAMHKQLKTMAKQYRD